jgi:hypothetical protein
MDDLKQQIQALLSQDLMLEKSFKTQVLTKLETLSQAQLTGIYNTLQKLVVEELTVIEAAVAKNPGFFHQLQHRILQIMHEDFMKKEEVIHRQAEVELVQNLQNITE